MEKKSTPFTLSNHNNSEPNQASSRIVVFGVGGGGGNAVNSMIEAKIEGVEFIVGNTDVQALNQNLAKQKIQLGRQLTKGLGAGSNPDIGRESAIEDADRITEFLAGADMVFVTAGMGGGTGTGAAPVIAKIARDLNALTVGVVTRPFNFEGVVRSRNAEAGIERLKGCVDTLVTIANQRLIETAGPETTFHQATRMADSVLCNAVQGISYLITKTGFVNVDFADIRTVMSNKGVALMGIGRASGPNRASEAAAKAITSPLLDNISINGATSLLINITSGMELGITEVDHATRDISAAVDPEANIIYGHVLDEDMGDEVQVTVIATGFASERPKEKAPRSRAVAMPHPTTNQDPRLRAVHPAVVPPVQAPQDPSIERTAARRAVRQTFSGSEAASTSTQEHTRTPRTTRYLRNTTNSNQRITQGRPKPIEDRSKLDTPTFTRRPTTTRPHNPHDDED